MNQGRPPAWNPFADLVSGVWSEVADFGSKGRFGVPAAARRQLHWWGSVMPNGLIATLEPGGIARLEPWAGVGEAVLAQVRKALQSANPAARAELALAAMDRFMRIACEENGRLVMPSNLASHVDPTRTGRARVVVRDGELWVWQEDMWQSTRPERITLLANQMQ
jgi:DNA-binding transcriptional regulator/RsmH inhibitor MraZ